MEQPAPALLAEQFLRSVEASRATLRRPPMKLLDVVAEARALVGDAPYAVVGGLAQILWARKTHTDDLRIALAVADLERGYEAVEKSQASGWSLPEAPDRARKER